MSGNVIYGLHAVTRRVESSRAGRLLVKQGEVSKRVARLLDLAGDRGIEVVRCDAQELESHAGPGKAHQGVVFLVPGKGSVAPAVTLDDLLASPAPDALFLLLDGVTDPGNLGACLRSAASLGVSAVIAPRDGSAPLNADAIKRASGGAELVPYLQVTNLARAMAQLKAAGIWIVGTTLDAPQDIQAVDLTGPVALAMGSEGKGLRRRTLENCDFLATIPMVNDALGFNVSVATGICLYEAARQRAAARPDA